MRTRSRLVALILAAALAAPAFSQQPPQQAQAPAPQAPAQQEEEFESKFIWGILINYAVSKLSSAMFEIFMKWAVGKLTGGEGGLADRLMANLVRDSGAKFSSRATTTAALTSPGTASGSQPAQIVVGNPDKPLVADGKKENFQGVHMALMMAEDSGKTFAFRPVNQGFRTGERFKMRVLSTFGGELTIDNINPRGEKRQIYPPRPDQVVTLLPGSETLLPIDANQFFEFTGATGREQLVINVADARAVGAAASRNKVFRQDTKFGSNFLQEATGNAYPSITQAIELVHTAR